MSYTYFIRCGDYVKIGKANDPYARVKQLQTGNPVKLKLLGVIDNPDIERALHYLFGDVRESGEWFLLTPKIARFIEDWATSKINQSKTMQGKPQSKMSGWIEYQKNGTKNPKRYARSRQWEMKNGQWIKSQPKRVKSIRPLTEEEYIALKNNGNLIESFRVANGR